MVPVVEPPIQTKTKNANLHAARKAKQDEFYTQLGDIEAEVRHYSALEREWRGLQSRR